MERVLTFKYVFEDIEKVRQLKNVFAQNNIEFICYESSGYYSHEFIVRKSGKKWNDIYEIINSVKAARYIYKKIHLDYIDGELREVIYV